MTDLPEEVRAAAERLTRRARRTDDEATADDHRRRRDRLLDEHGFTARIRAEDAREVLVLYPSEWVEAGTVQTDRIEDLDRAVEIQLSGPGDPDDWDAVDEHNRAVAARVRRRHGDVHGDNAAAFADFMSNHYAKRVGDATPDEVAEFVAEYFPRNAWPSEEQRAVVESSVEYVLAASSDRTIEDPS